jgi:hypothetical protein
VIGYYGGFRICELKGLQFENVTQDQSGYWIEFVRSKQRGRTKTTTILVPRRQPDWVPVVQDSHRTATDIDPASFIDDYLEKIQLDYGVPLSGLTGSFFRGSKGKKGERFIHSNIGKNMLSRVGVEFATELGLENPETYTGHCWRRSCGTSASDAGVNVTTLMSLMGWASPKTAMEYVSKSRHSCLKMSMYLTNVQRQNRPLLLDPSEFSQSSEKTKSLSTGAALARVSNIRSLSEKGKLVRKIESSEMAEILADSAVLVREVEEEEEVMAASQALVDDLESSSSVSQQVVNSGGFVEPVVSASVVSDPVRFSDSSVKIDSRECSCPTKMGEKLTGMFPNLSNSGTMNINIYFGK